MKHLSNFSKTLNMPQVNCEVFLTLTCSINCVLADMTTTASRAQGIPPATEAPTGATFSVKDAKLYVSVVILSTGDDNKLLQ